MTGRFCKVGLCVLALLGILATSTRTLRSAEPAAASPLAPARPTPTPSPALAVSQEAEPAPLPESFQIPDFPMIYQLPELPTGCEVTALAMILNYYGLEIDKVQLAEEYLPTLSAQFFYGEDGRLYGPDLEEYFVGDPATEGGYVCGVGAILTAADAYLTSQGSDLQPTDATGTLPEELYRLVSQNTPVLVWVTIGMEERQPTEGWYTEEGEFQEWSVNDHGAVLVGYSPDTVTIADPLAGLVEYSRSAFESVYQVRGSHSLFLR